MIHTVNKPPTLPAAFDACVRTCMPESYVVLIEDGVYHATQASAITELLDRGVAGVYALEPDVTARGVGSHLAPGVQLIDYPGFVQLCCEAGPIKSWY